MLSDGVGRYGGTLRVSEAVGFMNQRGGELTTQMLDIYLLSMHQETLDIVPNIAAGYAVADDGPSPSPWSCAPAPSGPTATRSSSTT